MFEAISQWPHLVQELLPGLWVSIKLLGASVVIGAVMAFVLALGLRSSLLPVRWGAIVIVEVGRGIPALVLLYLVYFGLPDAGLTLSAFVAACVALGINLGAYTTDVIHSGLESVPVGQIEAAQALGLGPRTQMFRVVLPQAIRVITPAYLSWVIVLFQATSLAYAIAVPELMSAAYTEASKTFDYFNTLLVAGLVYAAVTVPGSQLVSWMERRSGTRSI